MIIISVELKTQQLSIRVAELQSFKLIDTCKSEYNYHNSKKKYLPDYSRFLKCKTMK